MSEKRYKILIPFQGSRQQILKDCKTNKSATIDVYDNNIDYFVDLLNEQQATINELEKNFDDIVEWASKIAKRNVILDEQIGQLQRENEQLKISLNEYGVDFSTFEIFKESIGYNEMIKSSSIKNKKVVR